MDRALMPVTLLLVLAACDQSPRDAAFDKRTRVEPLHVEINGAPADDHRIQVETCIVYPADQRETATAAVRYAPHTGKLHVSCPCHRINLERVEFSLQALRVTDTEASVDARRRQADVNTSAQVTTRQHVLCTDPNHAPEQRAWFRDVGSWLKRTDRD